MELVPGAADHLYTGVIEGVVPVVTRMVPCMLTMLKPLAEIVGATDVVVVVEMYSMLGVVSVAKLVVFCADVHVYETVTVPATLNPTDSTREVAPTLAKMSMPSNSYDWVVLLRVRVPLVSAPVSHDRVDVELVDVPLDVVTTTCSAKVTPRLAVLGVA